jgi:CubicO group peptidase (beta-lactamase class C family)
MRLQSTHYLLLSFIWAVPLSAQVDTARVDAVFARFAGHSPGCALNVIADGRSVYEKGYGYASLELDVPITPRTVFDIGSVSKQFTAMSILLLARDGKLSLDDDIRRYVPELPDLGHVTIRQLMHHTSGWRDYTDLMALGGWDERDHTTDQDGIDVLRRQRALNFPPGTNWRYSNTGFFLMSLVVKRVSGASLREFAAERIFAPLGMSDTRFLDDTRQIVPRRATAYAPADSGGGWQVEMANWDQVGDGAVQTTVEDLAKWDANFYTPIVGDARLVEMLQTPDQAHYGFGLWRDRYHDDTVVWHTGAWAGYRAVIMRFPDRRRSIIVLCNVADAHTRLLATRLADLMIQPRFAEPPKGPQTVRAHAMVGLYSSDAVGDILRVTTRGADTVLIEVGDRHHILVPSGMLLRDTTDGATYEFGDRRVVVRSFGDIPDTMRLVPPPGRSPGLPGRYVSPELNVTWTVLTKGSKLMLHRPRGDDLALAPLYADGYMTSDGTPVHFLRDASGQVTALSITTNGVHDLRFSRDRTGGARGGGQGHPSPGSRPGE